MSSYQAFEMMEAIHQGRCFLVTALKSGAKKEDIEFDPIQRF